MSAALSTIRLLGANIGQTSGWLLLVLASPMVEGASLFHPTGDVRATLAVCAQAVILLPTELWIILLGRKYYES
jgi:hypothetical protein